MEVNHQQGETLAIDRDYFFEKFNERIGKGILSNFRVGLISKTLAARMFCLDLPVFNRDTGERLITMQIFMSVWLIYILRHCDCDDTTFLPDLYFVESFPKLQPLLLLNPPNLESSPREDSLGSQWHSEALEPPDLTKCRRQPLDLLRAFFFLEVDFHQTSFKDLTNTVINAFYLKTNQLLPNLPRELQGLLLCNTGNRRWLISSQNRKIIAPRSKTVSVNPMSNPSEHLDDQIINSKKIHPASAGDLSPTSGERLVTPGWNALQSGFRISPLSDSPLRQFL